MCEFWLKEAKKKETEKQQHVIVTESNLFKGFTTKSVRNYDQKYFGKIDNDGRQRCESLSQESSIG